MRELSLIYRRTYTIIGFTSIQLVTPRKLRLMISPLLTPINRRLLVKVKVKANPVARAKRVRSRSVKSSPRRRVMRFG
jgi:hypothetical protein